MIKIYSDLNRSIGYLLGKASKDLAARFQRVFDGAGYDVTVVQWIILMILWENDGQSQQRIADAVEKDKTTVTRLINGMEKRNLIVRIPDRADHRQKLIYLTSKGKALEQPLMQLALQNIGFALKDIKKDHLKICQEVLIKICENIAKR